MKRLSVFRLILAAALAFSLFVVPAPAQGQNQVQSTFTVNSAGDAGDIDLVVDVCICNTVSPGNVCTLRAAIQTANACSSGTPHTITFAGDYTISVGSNLPALARNYTVLTAAGHAVTLQPSAKAATRGLEITASNTLISGLTISGFSKNIVITSGDSNRIGVSTSSSQRNVIINATYNGVEVNGGRWNMIAGNYIGLDTAGNQHANANAGVAVYAQNTIIGTNDDGNYDALEGNVISGNTVYGVLVADGGEVAVIGGNLIGLKGDGLTALGNGTGGVLVTSANDARIGADGDGTSDALQANIISANGSYGIYLDTSYGHKISGNIIGLAEDGDSQRGNTIGIQVTANSYNITIGVDPYDPSTSEAERNIISGNTNSGIYLQGYQTTVAGNYIGLDKTGAYDRGNGLAGISVSGHDNVIGTDGDGSADSYEGNVISGNNSNGISIYGANAGNNIVAGNLVGLNAAGSAALGNTSHGISLTSSVPAGTRIGTDGNGTSDTYERNVISGNMLNGIYATQVAGLAISGNYIGTCKAGNSDCGNSQDGIRLDAGIIPAATIGIPSGGNSAQGNVISGNGQNGIRIASSDNHVIAGNWIGVDFNGGFAIPNDGNGIYVYDSDNTRIGTDSDGSTDSLEKNLVSGNAGDGIQIDGVGSDNTRISGNQIGTNYDGDDALPNQYSGIAVVNNATNTLIGTNGNGVNDSGEGNIISGNTGSGIHLTNQSGTVIAGNVIGLSASHTGGSGFVPNGKGIWISAGMKSEVQAVGAVRIGTDANGTSDDAERNYIGGNHGSGIYISAGDGHIIAGNFIGIDWDGQTAVGNGDSGIYLINGPISGVRIGTNGDGNKDGTERNILSGNTGYGVVIGMDSAAAVAGNYIGTNYQGNNASPNSLGGVWLDDCDGNVVGVNGDNSAGEGNEGNLISGNNGPGVTISSGASNRVSGNWIGCNVSCNSAIPNMGSGVLVNASSAGNTIGSNNDSISDALEGNFISGNMNYGVEIQGPTSGLTYLYGNTIGLKFDQALPLSNKLGGVYAAYATGLRIGYDTDGDISTALSNIISGNGGNGILLEGTANDVRILGNRIGLNGYGNAAGNASNGVHIHTSYPKAEAASAGGELLASDPCHSSKVCVLYNWIGHNGNDGVFVDSQAGNGNQIMSNHFTSNGGLGIDLSTNGVNGNDTGDGDSGPNGLQNYPAVLTVGFPSPGNLRLTGSLNSTPSTTFIIELYAARSADPTNYGEGLEPIHTFSLTTNGSGNATFDRTFEYTLDLSYCFFSATATAPDWSTSEFGWNLPLDVLRAYLPMVVR